MAKKRKDAYKSMLANQELNGNKREEQVIAMTDEMASSKENMQRYWLPLVRNEFTIKFNPKVWQKLRENYVSIDPCHGPLKPQLNIDKITPTSIKVYLTHFYCFVFV